MSKCIPLTNGGHAIVDDEWYVPLSRWKWRKSEKGYAQRQVTPGTSIMMHQVVAMTPKALQTDHINGNKLDNRVANLRVCSNAENCRNRGPNKTGVSGFKGVHPHGSKWQAAITVNYKKVYIGLFDKPEDAARAYDSKVTELHRSFAYLNFPQATCGAEE